MSGPINPSDWAPAVPSGSFRGFRRRIRLMPTRGGMLAGLEDDFHCFELELAFDGEHVAAIRGVAERTPWRICPEALALLERRLAWQSFSAILAMAGDRAHCTHLLDLALLAVAHAADRQATCFDMAVSDPEGDRRDAVLQQDGRETLRWSLAGETIFAPAALAGVKLPELGARVGNEDPARYAQIRMLRRACWLARARQMATLVPIDIVAYRRRREGACFAYTDDRLNEATRRPDWQRDYSSMPDRMLAAWPSGWGHPSP